MTKFEKRVALHKISHFFKTTPLLIFFHCIDQKDFYARLTKSLINQKSKILSAKTNKQGDLNIAEMKDSIVKEKLIIKCVKNNYAKKVLLQNKAFFPLSTLERDVDDEKARKCDKKEKGLSRKIVLDKNQNMYSQDYRMQSKNKINSDSLFQGNQILIGFQNVNSLALIKDFIEDKNTDIFGGIYENSIIDQNQTRNLASIVQNQQVYAHLINLLKTPTIQLRNPLVRHLDFSYLLRVQYNLVAFSKALHSHHLNTSTDTNKNG